MKPMINSILIFVKLNIFTFFLFFNVNSFAQPPKIEMAITVDDLPGSGGSHLFLSRTEILEEMLKGFNKHQIKGVYGFANGQNIKDMPEHMAILKAWRAAGHKIGNHTYSHSHFTQSSLADYIGDVENNENFLKTYAATEDEIKMFRYPFLEEGDTVEKRNGLLQYFKEKNIKVAQVTVDFEDWDFGDAYIRCLNKRNKPALEKIKKAYLEYALQALQWSQHLSEKIYGKDQSIKHILLLHITALTAEMIDPLLKEYKKSGVQFISLEKAMTDPVYSHNNGFVNTTGMPFLIQELQTRKIGWENLHKPEKPSTLLNNLCKT